MVGFFSLACEYTRAINKVCEWVFQGRYEPSFGGTSGKQANGLHRWALGSERALVPPFSEVFSREAARGGRVPLRPPGDTI